MSSELVAGFGYFGKVPCRGDFIQANLPADFIKVWSEWLQAVIAVSREQQADAWLELYMTSPIWHFALASGVCGESAMVGSLMPSVDKVGRQFYFTLAKPVTGLPLRYWQQQAWSEHAEQMILEVLDDETDITRWSQDIAQADWLPALKNDEPLSNLATNSRQLVFASRPSGDSDMLLHQQLRERLGRYCIWWTAGSKHLPPTTLMSENLPLVSQFSAMLDGNWEQWGW